MNASLRRRLIVGVQATCGILISLWLGSIPAALGLFSLGVLALWLLGDEADFEEVAHSLEELSRGNLSHQRLTIQAADLRGRMATAVNQLQTQLKLLSEEALELANGEIGVQRLQEKVLQTGQLSVVDLPIPATEGDLNRSFAELTNQLRRLTVKAHIIGNDQLFNPALDEALPGEPGQAFAMMVSNLRTLAGRADDIAGGDLSSNLDGNGDLTLAFNKMVSGLRQLVEEVVASALHVATSTEEMMMVLRHYEGLAHQQALRIEQTQATMNRLFQSSDSIASSARKVFDSASATRESSHKISERIVELNQQSQRITEILNLIQSVADRSDLLALNASLEGIRAGEAGRGFALVANELRRLAENTKESVGEIKGLITDIENSTDLSARACNEGLKRSEGTTELAMEIKVVTGEQREKSGEVQNSMDELSAMLNQGLAGIRQVSVAAAELAMLSESLQNAVDRFVLRSEEKPSPSLARAEG